jgi:long-subunit fatty acid transport protein
MALLAPPARATPGAITIAEGAKSIGRAGADTAVFDDSTSVVRNPAMIMDSYRLRMDAHLGWLITRTRFRNPLNDISETSYDTVVPSVGIAWDPLMFGVPDDAPDDVYFRGSDIRLGFNIFANAGGGGSSELKTEVFPEGQTQGTSIAALAVAPTFGFRLFETLSFGIQPQLLLFSVNDEGLIGSTDGNSGGKVFFHRDAQGNPLPTPQPFLLGNGDQPTWSEVFALAGTGDSNSSTRSEVSSAYGIGFAGTIGMSWRPIEEFTFGLSYRFEGVIPKTTGDANLDAQRSVAFLQDDPGLQALLGPVLGTFLPGGGDDLQGDYDFELEDFKVPAILSMGVAGRPLPNWLIAFDFRYVFWKSAFESNDVTLTGGTATDINEINGSDQIFTTSDQFWDDSIVVAFGSSVGINDYVVLRAGYSYGSSPLNNDFGSPSSGGTEHHIAIGGSVFFEGWEWDAAFLWAMPNEQSIERHDSLRDLDNTDYNAEQYWFYTGVGYQF